MGWDDSHLHECSVGPRRFGLPNPEDRRLGVLSSEDERTVRLAGILGRVGSKAMYTYDFGDSWEHSIVLEKRLPSDSNTAYPVCTEGQLACPPEDCGGIAGFYNLVEALNDPNHERHGEILDWIGDSYDPEAFSADGVNRRLAPLRGAGARRHGVKGTRAKVRATIGQSVGGNRRVSRQDAKHAKKSSAGVLRGRAAC